MDRQETASLVMGSLRHAIARHPMQLPVQPPMQPPALPTGSEISGVVLSDQVKSLDWRAGRADLIEALPPRVTEEVLQ